MEILQQKLHTFYKFSFAIILCQIIFNPTLGVANLPVIPLIIKDHFTSASSGVHLYFCKKADALLSIRSFLNHPMSYDIHIFNGVYTTNRATILTLQKNQVDGIFLDFQCVKGRDFLQQENAKFNGSYDWLIWTTNSNSVLEVLKQSRVSVDSHVTLAKFSKTGNVRLFDLFRMHATLPFTITEISRSGNGKYELLNELPKKEDFQGIFVPAIVQLRELPNASIDDLTDYANSSYLPGEAVFQRYSFSFLTLIGETLNLYFRHLPAYNWGFPLPNGSWSDMVGDVQRGTADLSLCSTIFTIGRAKVVDFSFSIQEIRTRISFKQPAVFGSYTSLIRPLSSAVWGLLLAIVILSPVIIKLMANCNSGATPNQTYGSSLFIIVAALSQQGVAEDVPNEAPSMKIAYFFLLMCTYFTSVFYSSALLYFLILPSPKAIQNIHQLLASDFRIGIQDGGFFTYELTWNDSLSIQLRKKVEKSKPNTFPIFEGGLKIKKEKFALYHFDHYLNLHMGELFSQDEICSLSEVVKNRPYPSGALFGKNSPYREVFNKKIILLIESGIKDRLKKLWYPKKPVCKWRLQALSIGFEPLILTYAILWFGITTSLFFYFFELITFRYVNK